MMPSTEEILPYVGLEEVKDTKKLVKCLVAEFLGVLFLVLIGCGSVMGDKGGNDLVRIALCFGVTVATMAQGIGHISGCHINPAVTFGLLFGRKIGILKSLAYIIAQCIGGIAGSGILKAVGNKSIRGYTGLGQTELGNKVTEGQAFGIEFLITFVLVLVVFAAAADEDNAPNVKGSAPLAIGLSITTCHLFAIPFTGSSMNPARSFGPAVILGKWKNHWVYWVGPILGGICASLVYQLLFKAPEIRHEGKVYDSVSTKEDKAEKTDKEEMEKLQGGV